MKPVYIGLLVFAATVAIGLLAIVALSPTPKHVDVAFPRPTAMAPAPGPAPARETSRPGRKTQEARRTTPAQTFGPGDKADPFPKPPVTGRPTGGAFSGSDPSDPRIYQ